MTSIHFFAPQSDGDTLRRDFKEEEFRATAALRIRFGTERKPPCNLTAAAFFGERAVPVRQRVRLRNQLVRLYLCCMVVVLVTTSTNCIMPRSS
jgi:hypothetical protein